MAALCGVCAAENDRTRAPSHLLTFGGGPSIYAGGWCSHGEDLRTCSGIVPVLGPSFSGRLVIESWQLGARVGAAFEMLSRNGVFAIEDTDADRARRIFSGELLLLYQAAPGAGYWLELSGGLTLLHEVLTPRQGPARLLESAGATSLFVNNGYDFDMGEQTAISVGGKLGALVTESVDRLSVIPSLGFTLGVTVGL